MFLFSRIPSKSNELVGNNEKDEKKKKKIEALIHRLITNRDQKKMGNHIKVLKCNAYT